MFNIFKKNKFIEINTSQFDSVFIRIDKIDSIQRLSTEGHKKAKIYLLRIQMHNAINATFDFKDHTIRDNIYMQIKNQLNK